MSDQTPGQKIMARLVEAKTANGQKMTQDQGAAIIDGMIKELGLSKKRVRVNGRDELFDGLCVACGMNPNEVTRPAGATIGTALADIAAVTPDLTPEEFGMRAARYKRMHPDWELTPSALATHWGELGSGDTGQTVAAKYANAPHGWEAACRLMLKEADWSDASAEMLVNTGWNRLSLQQRAQIQKRLGFKATPAVKPHTEPNELD